MIGVDTDIVVRFFVDDDPGQAALAREFINDRTIDDPAFVSIVVVAELVWALEQIYAYSRTQVLAVVALLLASANVVVEREELLKAAIAHAGATKAEVADSVIAFLAQAAGARATMTFDREAAKRIPGMELLK